MADRHWGVFGDLRTDGPAERPPPVTAERPRRVGPAGGSTRRVGVCGRRSRGIRTVICRRSPTPGHLPMTCGLVVAAVIVAGPHE